MPSTRSLRLAGLLYLLIAVLGVFGLLYVPRVVVAPGDPAGTVANLRTLEGFFRFGIAVELFGQVLFLFVPLALYRIFKGVSGELASLVVILALVSVPLGLMAVVFEIGAVSLANAGDIAALSSRSELDALTYVLFRLHGQTLLAAGVFWGLWLLPLAALQLGSGFVPRIVGVLVMIAGLAYTLVATVAIALPAQAGVVGSIASFAEAGELATVAWLLLAGSRWLPRRALGAIATTRP
jgi:hypothetical protein